MPPRRDIYAPLESCHAEGGPERLEKSELANSCPAPRHPQHPQGGSARTEWWSKLRSRLAASSLCWSTAGAPAGDVLPAGPALPAVNAGPLTDFIACCVGD